MSLPVNTIYGLYAITNCDYEKVHSISLNKEKLEEIMNTQITNEIKKKVKFEIKPIRIYLLVALLDNPFGLPISYNLVLANSINVETFKNKIFAFNKCTTYNCTQCLVAIAHNEDSTSDEYQEYLKFIKNKKIFYNNISENSINFDIYYDEGISNV